jgi:hypothetical protein
MKTLLIVLLSLSGCASATGDSGATVQVLNAPDGSRCYAIMQGAEVRGGNCK